MWIRATPERRLKKRQPNMAPTGSRRAYRRPTRLRAVAAQVGGREKLCLGRPLPSSGSRLRKTRDDPRSLSLLRLRLPHDRQPLQATRMKLVTGTRVTIWTVVTKPTSSQFFSFCCMYRSLRDLLKTLGAEEGTRTPTPLRVRGPEPRASANSATSARDTRSADCAGRAAILSLANAGPGVKFRRPGIERALAWGLHARPEHFNRLLQPAVTRFFPFGFRNPAAVFLAV